MGSPGVTGTMPHEIHTVRPISKQLQIPIQFSKCLHQIVLHNMELPPNKNNFKKKYDFIENHT